MGEAAADILDSLHDSLSAFHDRTLKDFLGGLDWKMPRRELEPSPLPCLRHLDRAAEAAGSGMRPLARLLADCGGYLRWGQTYSAEDLGEAFLDNYGWTEIFGTRGHFVNDAMAGGFLLLGPHTAYPDHHHMAEELYIPLTGGTLWRMADAPLAPRASGEVIYHRSNVRHAMATRGEPLLAFYLWRGGDLAQRSILKNGG